MLTEEDSYWHKGLRKKLIETIAAKGIKDEKVLSIMNAVPRHLFIDSALIKYAYENKALPIECEQTISHPFTVAYQTQLLDISKDDKILEIGTGSGYQTIVLAAYKAMVFTIERQKILYDKFSVMPLLKKYHNVKCFYGDGYKGLKTYAPFDKILITAAVPTVPQQLLEQLKPGGIMVVPINTANKTTQEMKKIIRLSATQFKVETFDQFQFVPMLEGKKSGTSKHLIQ